MQAIGVLKNMKVMFSHVIGFFFLGGGGGGGHSCHIGMYWCRCSYRL